MKVVGISGYLKSGKDTVSDRLVEKYDYIKYSTIDTLKGFVEQLYDFPAYSLDTDVFKDTPHPALGGKTPRYLLIKLGHLFLSDINIETFTDYTKRYLRDMSESTGKDKWVIPNVKNHAEAAMIRELGGTLISIVRPSIDPTIASVDVIEGDMLQIRAQADHTIMNVGTLADLYGAVDKLVTIV